MTSVSNVRLSVVRKVYNRQHDEQAIFNAFKDDEDVSIRLAVFDRLSDEI